MTVIWPDGTRDQIPDEVPGKVQQFIAFAKWYDSLPKETQEAVKEDLQQHGRRDRGAVNRF